MDLTSNLSDDQIRSIEENTREQSDDELWVKVRKHRITSTLVGPIVKRRNVTEKFLKSIKTPCDLSRVPAIRWG